MYNSVIWMTITYIRVDKDKIYFNIRNSNKDQ